MSEYTYVPTLVSESDDSYIVKREFMVVDCTPQLPVESCDLFNATRCGNDECYAQPFVSEILYFQWRFPMPLSMALPFTPSIVDKDFNPIVYEMSVASFGLGYDADYQTYQWLNIDSATIPSDVDYFHVKIAYGDGNVWYSEPFERVKCDEETIVIEGVFNNNGKDCFKNYHGTLPTYTQSGNGYASQTRIYGTVEKIGIGNTKEYSEDVEISTSVEQVYLLRSSRPVPPYVADKVAECFSGSKLKVDGVEYKAGARIDKDFEEGRMWIISSEITQSCTIDNFKCS